MEGVRSSIPVQASKDINAKNNIHSNPYFNNIRRKSVISETTSTDFYS